MDKPTQQQIAGQVAAALREDLGSGDLTAGLIPADSHSKVEVVCRDRAVICGIDWFVESFRQLSEQVDIQWQVADGDAVAPGQLLCRMQAPTRALLTGERTALNFLQTLSGTASLAARYAETVAGTGARVLDTRKTLPGLRFAQKYAVRCGGCFNHRAGLFDAILIKENHINAAGSITAAVQAALATEGADWVEVEVENLAELEEALAAGAQRLLLDNFDLPTLREAVSLNGGRARLEASGGIALDRLRAIAETGVDDISVGALTKDVVAVDLSMRFV